MMKNIHILPTDKPTGIFKSGDNLLFSITFKVRTNHEGFHIYITSDEEIKEGDWVITNNGLLAKVITEFTWHFINSKKIILTDNKGLIEDGVQAIDDEFLQWFVKNPSCEEVEIEEGVRYEDEWIDNEDGGEIFQHQYCSYKIIIPKEEPKQEKLTYTESAKKEERISNCTMMKRKQETLEEVAVNFWAEGAWDNRDDFTDGFIEGAKWQQERMYSEEEVERFNVLYTLLCLGF